MTEGSTGVARIVNAVNGVRHVESIEGAFQSET